MKKTLTKVICTLLAVLVLIGALPVASVFAAEAEMAPVGAEMVSALREQAKSSEIISTGMSSTTAFDTLANWIKNADLDVNWGDEDYFAIVYSEYDENFTTSLQYTPADDEIIIFTTNTDYTSSILLMWYRGSYDMEYYASFDGIGTVLGYVDMSSYESEDILSYSDITNNTYDVTDYEMLELASLLFELSLLQYDVGAMNNYIGVSITDIGFTSYYSSSDNDSNGGEDNDNNNNNPVTPSFDNSAYDTLAKWLYENGDNMVGDGRYSYMIFNSDESQYYTTLVYDANTHEIEIQTSDMSWTSGVTLYLSKNSKEVIASAYIENTMCTMYAVFNMDEINYNDKFIADADLSNDSAYTDSQAKELCTALVHMALLEYDLGQADYSVGVSLTDLGFVTYYNDTNPDDNVGQNTTPDIIVTEPSEDYVPSTGFKYQTLSNGNLMITGIDSVPSELVIPAEIDGVPVEKIGFHAFSYKHQIETLVIMDGVEVIGEYAFAECENLNKVIIPDSVHTVEADAFWYCDKIEEVNLKGAQKIDSNAFGYCKALKDIYLSDNLADVEFGAFYECGVETVYFAGRESDWNSVDVGTNNDPLLSAEIIYLSQEPQEPPVITPPTAAPPVYVPEITVPETTVPETTVPETTVPETTVPVTTTEPFVEPEIIITDKPGVSADSVDGLVIGYMGDNDANGNVNIKDATNIQKYIAKLISFSTKQSALSDVDQSGEINIRDATTIQKHLAGFGVVSKIECLMYETGNHVHNHIEIVVEPGCLAKGYTNHSCICGDEYHTNETNAVGHKYVASVTKPTCTEKGYTTHQCSRCRDTYKDTYTNATGHSYSSKVTKPTCVDDGYTTYTCKNCKDTYTGDYKSATGEHNFNSSGKCKTCGYKKPASSSAFDKLANYIKKYGSLTDDGEEYIYSLYMSDYEQFATLFYNLDDGTIDLFLVATDDYGNVSTTMNISLTKGSSYFDYACIDEKFLMTGSLKMSSITYDMPSIDYEDIYYYESASEAYVAGITISMLDLSLLNYMLYDETYGLPVSIQELGFTNYYVN